MDLVNTDVTKKELQDIAFVDTIEEYQALNRTKDEKISDMLWYYVHRKDEKKAEKQLDKLSNDFLFNFFPEGLSQMFERPRQ